MIDGVWTHTKGASESRWRLLRFRQPFRQPYDGRKPATHTRRRLIFAAPGAMGLAAQPRLRPEP
jgi:hypothetical protein